MARGLPWLVGRCVQFQRFLFHARCGAAFQSQVRCSEVWFVILSFNSATQLPLWGDTLHLAVCCCHLVATMRGNPASSCVLIPYLSKSVLVFWSVPAACRTPRSRNSRLEEVFSMGYHLVASDYSMATMLCGEMCPVPNLLKGPMKWMILLGKIIMLSTLNNKSSIICSHIQLYCSTKAGLFALWCRTFCIKQKVEFQTGSDKNITGYMTEIDENFK